MIRSPFAILVRVLLVLCVVLGTSCSGGEEIATAGPVLRGTASLTSTGGGQVSVRAVHPDGGLGRVLATGRTDALGRFELSLPAEAGPVRIIVSGNTGPNTERLSLTLPSVPRQDVAVTLLTDVASRLVPSLRDEGGEIADAINMANSAVARASGLSTITQAPARIDEPMATVDRERAQYTLALAALSRSAQEKGKTPYALSRDLVDELRRGAPSAAWGNLRRVSGTDLGAPSTNNLRVLSDGMDAHGSESGGDPNTSGGASSGGPPPTGDPLVIQPGSNVTRPPRGSVTFTASGGNGSYTWSFVSTPAPSGGSITADGVYTAGSIGNVTDSVRVRDQNGNSADVDVQVTSGITITSVPATLTVAPLATIDFDATGGNSSGFSWTLEKHSGGDASMNAATGAYKAGSTGNGTDVVRVTDDLGNTASVNVSVTAPLALAASAATVPPRGTATFTASAGQPPYTYELQTSASGAPTITTAGAYTAGPTPNVTDVIRVTDTNGAVVTRSIAVGAGVTIAPSSPSAPPRGSIAFTATGGSGTGFTWELPTNASGGTIVASTGAYAAGETPQTVDQVRVVDSLGNSAQVTVSVGSGLAISPAGPTTPPRGSIVFTVVGGSGTGFHWSMVTSASGGSINPTTGRFTAGNTGSAVDRIRVTDSIGNSASVDITVGPSLQIAPSSAEVASGALRTFSASGGSGTGIVFELATNASGGSITSGGEYHAGLTGPSVDSVVATDSLGNTATAQVSVSAPLAVTPVTASTPPGGTESFTATGGVGVPAFSFQANLSGGEVSASGAYVAGRTGAVTDLLHASDESGASVTVTVAVGPGITITPASASVPPLGSATFQATGGSETGYVWSLATNSSGGSITAAGEYHAGSISSTVDAVLVTDSLGNTATVNVSIDGGTAISPASPSAPPRGSIAFSAVGGAGGFTWSLATNASGGAIDAATGKYTAGPKGAVTDIVKVTDAAGESRTVAVEVGKALRVSPETANAKPGTAITFEAAGGSRTGFVWSLASNLSGGSLSAAGVYEAGATANVTDTITVTDSLGNTAQASVSVTSDGNAPAKPPAGSPSDDEAKTPALDDGADPKSQGTGGCSSVASGASAWMSGAALLFALVLALRTRRRR